MHNHQYLTTNTVVSMVLFLFIIISYLFLVQKTNIKFRKWPQYRTICFVLGTVCVAFALIGPIADKSHNSFTYHMYSHLLLGMLGPLLISLSSPVTLMYRALPIRHARKLSKFLKSTYIRTVSHPIVASILNIGGLWILYTTNLFEAMHHSTLLFVIVHIHLFLAGYVFTISIVSSNPTPHRASVKMRAIVLILAMAGHGILSKWIYANPPHGVTKLDAEFGGMLMYYAGDFIDLIIVVLLCYEVYKSVANKKLPYTPMTN